MNYTVHDKIGHLTLLTRRPETLGSLMATGITAPDFGHRDLMTVWIAQCDCGQKIAMPTSQLKRLETSAAKLGKLAGCHRCFKGAKRVQAMNDPLFRLAYIAWQGIASRLSVLRGSASGVIAPPRYLTPRVLQLMDPLAYHADECWKEFEEFFRDMGGPPTAGHRLHRLDQFKGFYASNCAWLTLPEIHARRMSRKGKHWHGIGSARMVFVEGYGVTPYAWVEGTHLDPGAHNLIHLGYDPELIERELELWDRRYQDADET